MVTFNKQNKNPFKGMKHTLDLFNSSDRTIDESMLNEAYKECDTKEKRQLFYTILFSIGDITNRQHNIFRGKKKDNGGNANRDSFHIILEWLWKSHKEQFIKFLNKHLFEEYTCFDHLFINRVRTEKGKTKVLKVYNKFSDKQYRNIIAEYIYSIIKGNNPFNKFLIAKFLTPPRLTKRAGHKKMLSETRKVMKDKARLLRKLSELMGWEYEFTDTVSNFRGYREWRKQYNCPLESVLFSSGKIEEFDKESFLKWLDKLPAKARYRVKNRVLYSKVKDTDNPKYPELKLWYLEWERNKEEKQHEQRVLEEKVRQNQATEEDVTRLQKVKKEAKVTVGATNFNDLYNDILNNNIDKLKLESFINKVNLPYNSLVIIDDSGSMQGAPFNFATFIASVCLVKNPDDDARNLLGFFNRTSRWYSYMSFASDIYNSILKPKVRETAETPFVDPHKSFYENYQRVDSFCRSVFNGGMTHIDSIPEGLNKMCQNNPQMIDVLKTYPVWTIISDCDFNNLPNPKASMQEFFNKCERYFGFKPFVVAIAIKNNSNWNYWRDRADEFAGIDNFMYIPSNPAQIEQFLTNFKDMDTFDVYTPLLSLYRSNRYDLVRKNVI